MPRPNLGYRLSEAPNAAGFYEIRWTEGGRSKRLSTGERAVYEAQVAFARFLLDGEQNVEADTRREENGLTVREVCDHYVAEHVRDLALEESRKRIPARLDIICAAIGNTYVRDLTQQTVRTYLRDRADGRVVVPGIDPRTRKDKVGQKAKASSCRNELAQLVAAIRFAVEEGKLRNVDAPKLKLPDAPEPRHHYLEREQVAQLLAANAPTGDEPLSRAYRLVILGMSTAARMEAMQQLTWDRVDFRAGMIDFNVPGRPLTKKRRVKLPMSPSLRAMLERAYEERTTSFVLDHDGKLNQTFRWALTRAKLTVPKGCGVHLLRHTWATWQAQDGQSMTHIASVLGDTVQTTEKYYARHSPDRLGHVVDAVELPSLPAKGETGVVLELAASRVSRGVTPRSGVKTAQQTQPVRNKVEGDFGAEASKDGDFPVLRGVA